MYEISLDDARRQFSFVTQLNPDTIKVTEANDNFNSWRPQTSIRHTFSDPKREEYDLYVVSEDWALIKINARFGREEIYPAQNLIAYESDYPSDTRYSGETIGEAFTREVKQPTRYIVLHYQKWDTPDTTGELQASEVIISESPGIEAVTNSPSLRSLRVFLCYSSNDKPVVRDLYHRLCAENIDPWLNEERLLPGQDWNQEIMEAVRTADAVIVCLSRGSINKAGYVQKEIRYALDVADEQPEGTIFLIPLKLEECDVPQRLRRWQWVDYFDKNGYKQLINALRVRAQNLGTEALPVSLSQVVRKYEGQRIKAKGNDRKDQFFMLNGELHYIDLGAAEICEKHDLPYKVLEVEEEFILSQAPKGDDYNALQMKAELEKIGIASEKTAERKLLTQLRQILATRFDDGELHTLSFDLGVDYDSLPGAGKADKAREIVDYFNRRNRIPDLVEAVKKQRPDISLDDTSDKKSTDSSLLGELLNELPVITNLDFYHPDFQTWHTMVKLSLRQTFGESSYLVTEYDKIAWHTSDKLEDANEQRNLFSRSCIAAEGLLRTAVNMQRKAA